MKARKENGVYWEEEEEFASINMLSLPIKYKKVVRGDSPKR